MLKIVFKNLERSELVETILSQRMQPTIDRFPELKYHRLKLILSMDNSKIKPGPDLFKVKILINGKKYNGIILEKSASSLYLAFSELAEYLLERLNRFNDKKRIKNRNEERKLLNRRYEIQTAEWNDHENSLFIDDTDSKYIDHFSKSKIS